jgi:hypothetical protein
VSPGRRHSSTPSRRTIARDHSGETTRSLSITTYVIGTSGQPVIGEHSGSGRAAYGRSSSHALCPTTSEQPWKNTGWATSQGT